MIKIGLNRYQQIRNASGNAELSENLEKKAQ